MKKLLLLGLISIMTLSGCVYSKILVVKTKGDKVNAPIGSVTPIEGKNVSGFIVYQSFITDERGREIPPIADVIAKELERNTGELNVVKK